MLAVKWHCLFLLQNHHTEFTDDVKCGVITSRYERHTVKISANCLVPRPRSRIILPRSWPPSRKLLPRPRPRSRTLLPRSWSWSRHLLPWSQHWLMLILIVLSVSVDSFSQKIQPSNNIEVNTSGRESCAMQGTADCSTTQVI